MSMHPIQCYSTDQTMGYIRACNDFVDKICDISAKVAQFASSFMSDMGLTGFGTLAVAGFAAGAMFGAAGGPVGVLAGGAVGVVVAITTAVALRAFFSNEEDTTPV